jgi:hypothetical protein
LGGSIPAALNAGIIVAAKANQNPPVTKYERHDQGPKRSNATTQLTDSTKNNARKRVAEYELQDAGDEQQQAAKEDDGSANLHG